MSDKKVIVFDFDKTLTDRDTLVGFYKEVTNNRFLFKLKYLFLLFFAVLYKLKLINNGLLKKVGVSIFLKGRSKSFIEVSGALYASKIKLNRIFYTDFLEQKDVDYLILTASFEEYVNPIFEDNFVFGSKLEYKENRVSGLKLNLFGEEKLNLLNRLNISKVDTFYTDSLSDKPIIDISENVFLIINGTKKNYKKNGIYC